MPMSERPSEAARENLAKAPAAYLAGVLHGDGWCTALTIGLRCKDEEFSRAFAGALVNACGIQLEPRLDERGYWLVRTSNKTGRYNHLRPYEPTGDAEYAAWLRGLFDSEGNAQLTKAKNSENAWARRVAFYSTNTDTLDRAGAYLTALSIDWLRYTMNPSKGHKGDKPVYELRVGVNRENFARFAAAVGSSIARKQKVLDAIPRSYQAGNDYFKRAQRLGAAAKHRRLLEVTLPRVVAGVRELISQGIDPTQSACRIIPGYNSVQRHIRQADLVALARRAEDHANHACD
jgi:hypothetical protein